MRRKERGRTRRGQQVWKRTGRPMGRPKKLVPIVRLAGKQRLLPSKAKAKIANTLVRSDEIKRLEVELAMQGKSILALQRKVENLQGELDVHNKTKIADAMEKESILALQREVGNLQNEVVVHIKRKAADAFEKSQQCERLRRFAVAVRWSRSDPERDLALEKLAKHVMEQYA